MRGRTEPKAAYAAALCGLTLALGACALPELPEWMGGEAEARPKIEGNRYAVLPEASLSADAALADIAVTVPPAVLNAQWPQHMGTPRASIGNLEVAEDFRERQSAAIGAGNEWEEPLVIQPVTGGDTVFAMDAAGVISAHALSDIGQLRWTSRALANDDEDDILGGGLAYENGRLFAASGRGALIALDAASGQEIWRQKIGLPFRSPPKVDRGRLYAVSLDNQLFALDAESGAIEWSARGIDETTRYLSAVSPAAAYGIAVAPFSSGELRVLRADGGGEVWSDTLILPKRTLAASVFSGIGADPVIHDGTMYVVGSGGLMAAYRLHNGQRLWEVPVSSVNTPWLAGDFLYVLTVDNQLVCLRRADGRIKWARALPSFGNEEKRRDRRIWTGPVMAGGRLLVTGAHGEMLIVSPRDGSVIDVREIPQGVYAPPVIAAGQLYLAGRGARLYLLK